MYAIRSYYDLRGVLPFVGGDDQRAFDRAVDVGHDLGVAAGVREFLHRADDPRDVLDAVERLAHRHRHLLDEIGDVGGVENLADARAERRIGGTRLADLGDRAADLAERGLEEAQVVADVLDRRVDLVRNAGGELTDAREPRGLQRLALGIDEFGDVRRRAAIPAEAAVLA